MNLDDAIACLKANGYKVSKVRGLQARHLGMNAIGRPYSPDFRPTYRMKYRTPALKRAQNVGTGIGADQWARMCANAKAHWEHALKHDTPLPHDIGKAPVPA